MKDYFCFILLFVGCLAVAMNFDNLQEDYLSRVSSELKKLNDEQSSTLKKELIMYMNFAMDVFPLEIHRNHKKIVKKH